MKNIYLAKQNNSDLYKIGITGKSPEKRLKELQTGNAVKLILVDKFQTKHGFLMETAMHAIFKLKRKEGEWFELSEEDVLNFQEYCKEKEATMDLLKSSNYFWGG